MSEYVIRLKISEEKDLYHPLDADWQLWNDDVVSYVMHKYSEKHFGEKPELYIVSDQPVNDKRVRASFQKQMTAEMELLKKEKRMSNIKQLRLFLIGLVFISLWLFLSARMDGVWPEVLSIVGSFSVWEAANIWIVGKPELRMRKRRLQYLAETEIVFEQA